MNFTRFHHAAFLASATTAVLAALTFHAARAEVPPVLHYQGRVGLNNGAGPFSGAGQFKFALYSPSGNTSVWSHDGTSLEGGGEPLSSVPVTVRQGSYSVRLGDTSLANMQAVPSTVFQTGDLHLRVWFNDGVNGFQRLNPDQALASVGYAMVADSADQLRPSARINAAHIPDGILTSGHLQTTGTPASGQILSFNGTSLAWIAPPGGGGGDSVFSRIGSHAYFNSGNIGIGSAESPPAPLTVTAAWNGDASIPNVQLVGASPTLMWGRLALVSQFHNYSWILKKDQNPSGGTGGTGNLVFFRRDQLRAVLPGGNGSDTGWQTVLSLGAESGNVGIGITNPNTGSHKLQIFGQDALSMTGTQPHLTFVDISAAPARNSRIRNTSGTIVFQVADGPHGAPAPLSTAATLSSSGLHVNDNASVKTLTIRGGADLAEPFAMSHQDVPPGAVVVIDEANPGQLRMSRVAYDTKVAGIVSGAHGINPGISMIQEDVLEPGLNVSLSGRVYVKANTGAGPIEPGDLLTTSDIPGEAMKAADHTRAQGAILGKAMTGLSEKSGFVLVLVTLQ